jgi:DNA-binding response OmpR family regulator
MSKKSEIRNAALSTSKGPKLVLNGAEVSEITRVLLIEDNEDDVLILREMLAGASGTEFDLAWADRLSTGLERLAAGGFELVLLDLGLPDSQGLDTLGRVRVQAPDVPILVLTGLGDERLDVKAMQAGAQDCLVKGQVDGNLLVRAMRYAIERQRLLAELEGARQREQQERELRSLAQLSSPPSTAVTAQLFGVAPLSESVPEVFNELAERYEELMDLALEQRAYKVEHNISERLRSLAERVGFLKAGPRDVVEIHSYALKRKTREVAPARAQAYVEEGRLMLLELMGYLVSYYRNR